MVRTLTMEAVRVRTRRGGAARIESDVEQDEAQATGHQVEAGDSLGIIGASHKPCESEDEAMEVDNLNNEWVDGTRSKRPRRAVSPDHEVNSDGEVSRGGIIYDPCGPMDEEVEVQTSTSADRMARYKTLSMTIPNSQGRQVKDHQEEDPASTIASTIRGAMGQVMEEMKLLMHQVGDHLKAAQRAPGDSSGDDREILPMGDVDKPRKKKKSQKPSSSDVNRRMRDVCGPSANEESSDCDDNSTDGGRIRSGGPKLPPFTGSETWEVWINRFEDVAGRRKWRDAQKLDALLPRLQGNAGEFVFGQLPPRVRNDYLALTRELKNRFRKVETAKAFGSRFRRRAQKQNESLEEYAGELKRLYDKAYPLRDAETRREDLLRTFLDGLIDDEAGSQVEYVKEPVDIDEAVYEVVNYIEAHRKLSKDETESKKGKKFIRATTEVSDSEEERVARLPGRPAKQASVEKDNQGTPQGEQAASAAQAKFLSEIKKLQDIVQSSHSTLTERLEKLETTKTQGYKGNSAGPTTGQAAPSRPGQRNSGYNRPNRSFDCFNCGQPGHFARSCLMGQFQLSTSQPEPGSAPQMSTDPGVQSMNHQNKGN